MPADPTAAERIRTAAERNARAVALRPSMGQGTAVTTVRLTGDLACTIEEGPWRFAADMGEKHGGAGAAPNPGVLVRGALGACLTITIATWAARLGVSLDDLAVEVEADYDARGELGVADVPPGYAAVRTTVTVASPAPEADVRRVLDHAERCTSLLDVFRRGIPVQTHARIVQSQPA